MRSKNKVLKLFHNALKRMMHLFNIILRILLNIPFVIYLKKYLMKLPFPIRVVIIFVSVLTLWLLSGIFISHNYMDITENIKKVNDSRVFFKTKKSQVVEYNSRLLITGTAVAKHKVQLFAEVTGKIISIPVNSGDKLKKGDVIIKIEAKNKEETMKQYIENLNKQRSKYESTLALYSKQLSSKYDLDNAKADLNAAEASFKNAQLDWKNTLIIAPFDGYIDYIEVKEGQLLDPLTTGSTPIATFVDMSKLTAQVNVVAKDLKDITKLSKSSIYFEVQDNASGNQDNVMKAAIVDSDNTKIDPKIDDANKTDNIKDINNTNAGDKKTKLINVNGSFVGQKDAEVTFISKVASTTNGTFLVELEIDNSDMLLVSGQDVEVGINTGKKMAHKLPQSSLILNDSGVVGIKVLQDNNIVKFYEVNIVGEEQDGVWLTGLPSDVAVIVLGQAYIGDGDVLSSPIKQDAVAQDRLAMDNTNNTDNK